MAKNIEVSRGKIKILAKIFCSHEEYPKISAFIILCHDKMKQKSSNAHFKNLPVVEVEMLLNSPVGC